MCSLEVMITSIDRPRQISSPAPAFWSEMPPHLSVVQVKCDRAEAHIFFYFEDDISERDSRSVVQIARSVEAWFPRRTVFEHCLQYKAPQQIPFVGDHHVVFARKERSC